jgi:hypothetical protein
LADIKGIKKEQQSFTKLIDLYDDAIAMVKKAVQEEKSTLGIKEKYVHGVFFKRNKPKMFIQKMLSKSLSKNKLVNSDLVEWCSSIRETICAAVN